MVKTLLAVVIALAGLSSAANATPSVVLGSPDPDAVYGPGETVTLTVRVTVEGEVDNLVRGDFTFASSLVTPIAVQINGTLPGTRFSRGRALHSAAPRRSALASG